MPDTRIDLLQLRRRIGNHEPIAEQDRIHTQALIAVAERLELVALEIALVNERLDAISQNIPKSG